MSPPTIWRLEEHTRAKHEILRRYLGGWFPILTSSGSAKVLFLDGFAGPGVYSKGEPGSPIIALETLASHSFLPRLRHAQFLFLFIEKDRDRCTNLRAELDRFWASRGSQPANIQAQVVNATFEEVAGSMVATLREQRRRLAPTFTLIDPFGFKGIPIRTIADLLGFDRCEVMVSFMFNSINRFIDHPEPGIREHFRELFGTDEFASAAQLSGDERKQFLHDLYRRQLRDVAGFTYVLPFEMFNERGHNVYSLFYGTRSLKGVELMKDALWKLDPAAGYRFSDRLAGQGLLFSGANLDTGPLRTALLQRFSGQTVSVEEIKESVLVDTLFAASHFKPVLRALQDEGLLVPVSGQGRPRTFPDGTVVRFVSRS